MTGLRAPHSIPVCSSKEKQWEIWDFRSLPRRFGVLRWLWSCWMNMSGEGWVSPSSQSGMSPVLSIPQKPGTGGWTGPTRPLPTPDPTDDPRGCGVASSHPKGFEAKGSTRPSHPAPGWTHPTRSCLPSSLPSPCQRVSQRDTPQLGSPKWPAETGPKPHRTPSTTSTRSSGSIHNLHTFLPPPDSSRRRKPTPCP